jgi:urease accessory protein
MLPADLVADQITAESAHALPVILTEPELQRATGAGHVALRGFENGNRIVELFQSNPVRIMFPLGTSGSIEEAVFVNTGGGIAGGDQLEYAVTALDDASIAVTSQTAEKVYRALNVPARIRTKLKICATAKLGWLPQETILFDRSRIHRQMEIELTSGSEILALEWLVLGRAAHGEKVTEGQIVDSWRVKKDDRLIWADTFRAQEETFTRLHQRALLSNLRAFGTLVYFGPDLDTRLEFVRDVASSLQCSCAATIVNGLMIVRIGAAMALDLKLSLCSFLPQFARQTSTGAFSVPKMWSC